jgi:hypothetical protein
MTAFLKRLPGVQAPFQGFEKGTEVLEEWNQNNC